MAVIYCDFEAGSDGNDGSTWALAKLTLQAGVTAAGAGGTVYCRRTNAGTATKDTAGTRTITGVSNTVDNPVVIYGCADGTTAEPPTESDFETTKANQPELHCSTGGTLTFGGTNALMQFNFMRVISDYRFTTASPGNRTVIHNGVFSFSDNFQLGSTNTIETRECDIEWTAGGILLGRGAGRWMDTGSTMTWTSTSPSYLNSTSLQSFSIDWRGTDLSDFAGASGLWNMLDNELQIKMYNCLIPNTTYAANTPNADGHLEMVGCSHSSSVANASIQEYYKWDASGVTEIGAETRTGGADDQSSGQYSLMLTPHIDGTVEGSDACVTTPWMNIWVDAGAQTFTAYITNDSANLNEDDAWLEVLTPDSGDTPQHDVTYKAGNTRLITSTTAIATDTSVWTLASDFPQKLVTGSITVGYTGWAQARVCYAKRFASSPVPLYVDPLIEVT